MQWGIFTFPIQWLYSDAICFYKYCYLRGRKSDLQSLKKKSKGFSLNIFYVLFFFCVQAAGLLYPRSNLPDVSQGRVQWLEVINCVSILQMYKCSFPGIPAESLIVKSCFVPAGVEEIMSMILT